MIMFKDGEIFFMSSEDILIRILAINGWIWTKVFGINLKKKFRKINKDCFKYSVILLTQTFQSPTELELP